MSPKPVPVRASYCHSPPPSSLSFLLSPSPLPDSHQLLVTPPFRLGFPHDKLIHPTRARPALLSASSPFFSLILSFLILFLPVFFFFRVFLHGEEDSRTLPLASSLAFTPSAVAVDPTYPRSRGVDRLGNRCRSFLALATPSQRSASTSFFAEGGSVSQSSLYFCGHEQVIHFFCLRSFRPPPILLLLPPSFLVVYFFFLSF